MKFDSFESIIPTALHTAYPLIFTDIPYSKQIYDELLKFGFPENLKNEKIAVEIEARYKLISELLEQSGIDQVLELACGYTARGVDFCEKNPSAKFSELDLKPVIETKTKILEKITKIPENLKLYSGNALSLASLKRATETFDKSKPIAVINQGLMRYLNFDEKALLAKNIYKLISKNGGVWITCDVTPAKYVENQNKNISSNYNQSLSNVTNRNNISWRFKDREQVTEFYGRLGFEIEWHDYAEVKPLLTSPAVLGISSEEVDNLIAYAVVVVMRAKNKK